ncbi:MAG: hypothetical protein ACOYMF_06035 [Bacteroidales bacterium]
MKDCRILVADNTTTGDQIKPLLENIFDNFAEVYELLGIGIENTVTHAQLLAGLNKAEGAMSISPLSKYVISDYKSKDVNYEGALEPLVVFTITDSTLARNAWSTIHPKDIIEYDIDDVLCSDSETPRKGNITYRKDTNGNCAPWDIKAVKWLCKTFTAPAWSDSATYIYGILVSHEGWVWKSANNGQMGTEAGDEPGVSYKWIKYLPVGSLLLPVELVSTGSANNCGNAVSTGVTYGAAQYFYTFTNAAGEECSSLFSGFEIGRGSSNIVCFAETGKTLTGVKMGDNCINIRLAGNLYNSEMGAGSQHTIIHTAFTHSYLCQSNRNLIGNMWSSRAATVLSGNIIHTAGLGTLFQSETVFNDIDYMNDCVIGADFWSNRVQKMVYAGIGHRFTGNFVEDMTGITTVGLCYACYFPGECSDIFISGVCNSVIFPNSIKSLIFEAIISGGMDYSTRNKLSDETEYKKIVGNDAGTYILTRGEAGVEVITPIPDLL